MKQKIMALLALLLPSLRCKSALLRLMGWEIDRSVRLGHSWIDVPHFRAGPGASVGHGNFMKLRFIVLKDKARIGHLNQVRGPVGLVLSDRSAIGNKNTIKRAGHPIVWGHSILSLGVLTKITSGHLLDCTRPIHFGDYSILAGADSQLWTHGYIHASVGPDRFRIDGSISVGSNVYIGSRCVLNAGIAIASGITIGSNSCVSKSLNKAGLYVGQGLRYLPMEFEKRLGSGRMIEGCVEKVFVKKQV